MNMHVQPNGTNSVWTDFKSAMLADLWARGMTASAIGEQLGGMTKSQVIGKVHRLELPPRETKVGKEPAFKPQRRQRFKPKQLAPRIICEAVEPLHIGFTDLTAFNCHFPYGDAAPFTFCGHPSDGDSYCEYHRSVCGGVR